MIHTICGCFIFAKIRYEDDVLTLFDVVLTLLYFAFFFAYGDGMILTSLCYDYHNWARHLAEVRISLYLCLILVIAGVALVLVDALVEVRMLFRFDFILLHF